MLIDSKVYSIVTYFWKTNSMAIVITGAGAVVTKTTNFYFMQPLRASFIVFAFKYP